MTEIIADVEPDGKLRPLARFEQFCADMVGKRIILNIAEPQNERKRAMFHATLRDIYANLRDDISDDFLDYDHFRYWCEIKKGYATQQDFVCKSEGEAQRLLTFLRAAGDKYTIFDVSGRVIRKWTAESTQRGRMRGERLNQLIDDVLDFASSLIGVQSRDTEDA